jgi:hypothetical protein
LSDLLPIISTDFPCAALLTTLMMEAVQTSETLVNSNQSTRRYNPEDSHLHLLLPLFAADWLSLHRLNLFFFFNDSRWLSYLGPSKQNC